MRHWTMPILSICLLASGLLVSGCQSSRGTVASRASQPVAHAHLNTRLVLPGEVLLELAGPHAWPAGELNVLNHRRNEALGADRIPLMASVDEAEVRVWDQQWILNGRSMENYLRSTRSIQFRAQP